VLTVQLIVFAGFGLYRGICSSRAFPTWCRIGRRGARDDGQCRSPRVRQRFVGLLADRFPLDALLLVVLVVGVGSRSLPGRGAPRRGVPSRRSLIYGRGLAASHRARATEQSRPRAGASGSWDDDRRKHATRIHGLPVFGGASSSRRWSASTGSPSHRVVAKIHGNGLDAVTEVLRRRPCRSGRGVFSSGVTAEKWPSFLTFRAGSAEDTSSIRADSSIIDPVRDENL